ncbi:MAG: flagellar assembly protein FliW [Deltaproteobacteria bacterium]|nr:MAG: flagellar assembly protein FliW [Deltaproteobacteria bacterium]
MKIDSTRFGPITIGEERIITMPFGMLGFPEEKRYVILQHREDSPFFWYQSVDDPALAFVITSPFLFKPDYSVRLEDTVEQMSWIEDKDKGTLELYVVVNIPKSSPDDMTANLIGPILINNRTRQAVQMVITDSPYSHKFSLVGKNKDDNTGSSQNEVGNTVSEG